MTHKQLKKLRNGINFDMRSFALCVGIPLSTYQRYEDGTATIPVRIERAALELEQVNKTFIKELPKRVDAACKKLHPRGIMSEVSE